MIAILQNARFGYDSRKSRESVAIFKAAQLNEPDDLRERVDFLRIEAFGKATDKQRAKLGQFSTPMSVSALMASYLTCSGRSVKLLDAGAGVGSLTAAAIAELGARRTVPRAVTATAYELDVKLATRLEESLRFCEEYADGKGIKFTSSVVTEDFIKSAVAELEGPSSSKGRYNCAILNPPYRKLNHDSKHRAMLRDVGIEASNLYTAFLSLTVKLLEPNGEMVAIVPRSFCNGPYYKAFRQLLLGEMAIDAVHIFKSRWSTFAEEDVLQENIILHAVKTSRKPKEIRITSSLGASEEPSVQLIAPERLVNPADPECFLHLVSDETEHHVSEVMGKLSSSLADLGVGVSTGKVVDFRAAKSLRRVATRGTVPLIYPTHFRDGWIDWPREGAKKKDAIAREKKSENLLIPAGVHVLVKRFSAKEEKRRVVAAVFDPSRVSCKKVGFENRVNYFHMNGEGLPMPFAKGLAAYLNSSVVDLYLRQSNGHTQVNATDLRNMKYPTKKKLVELGRCIGKKFPPQHEIDELVERELLKVASKSAADTSMKMKWRIDEAISVLRTLGIPPDHQSEHGALTLLALLGLGPTTPWSKAKSPLRRKPQLSAFISRHYGKRYASKNAKAARSNAIRQFELAGIIVKHSVKTRKADGVGTIYKVDFQTLKLFKEFGSVKWSKSLRWWLEMRKSRNSTNPVERNMREITVQLPGGDRVLLANRTQNILIKHVIEDFCPRFTPGGEVFFVGGPDRKPVVYEEEKLAKLGITIAPHSKMPDVVIYFAKKKWLVLVAAVTDRGPVDAKRYQQLKELFADSKAGLVFVTTFLDRMEMKKHLSDIAWETEVWVAEAPAHLIHFNGERFLGPYS